MAGRREGTLSGLMEATTELGSLDSVESEPC